MNTEVLRSARCNRGNTFYIWRGHAGAARSSCEEIEEAVAIEVGDRGPDAAPRLRPAGGVDAPLRRDIDEPAVVVSEQAVGIAFLVRDEQIEIAVAVNIEPDGAHRLARIADASLSRHVGEVSAIVAEQAVRLVAKRDEQIEVAVVVVVDPRGLPRHAREIEAERRRDVGEMPAVAVIPVQLIRRASGKPDVEIDVAVAVEVAPRRDTRLDVVGDADGSCDVAEMSVVLTIETIRPTAEADELVELAVIVEIGPRVRLAARRAEQIGLHELKGGIRVLSVRDQSARDRDDDRDNANGMAAHNPSLQSPITCARRAVCTSALCLARPLATLHAPPKDKA